MTVEGQDIKEDFYAGNYKELRVTVVDKDDNLFDLTGATVQFALFQYKKEANVVLRKSSNKGSGEIEILVPETNGVLVIKLQPVDSINLNGTYRYQVDVEDSNGNPETVTTGRIEIFKNYALRNQLDNVTAFIQGV